MNRKTLALIAFALLISTTPLVASQFTGGYGLLHTNTAYVMPQGALDMSMYIRGYADVFSDLGYTLTNGTSALATTFGYTRHVEVAFTQILYQDLNATKTPYGETASMMIPGDTHIRFKIANYQINDKVFWGTMPILRYRVAKYHNIHLEPYASEGVELELMGLLSYYEKPLYPDDGLSMHFNLSYLNHNDGETPLEAAQSMTFLLGLIRPREKAVDYGAELYGSLFLKRPNKNTLSREDWMYITPVLRYNLFLGLRFTLGLDILVLGHDDTSEPTYTDISEYPNMPEWRLSGRINFMPSTAFFATETFVKVEESGTTPKGRARRSYGGGASASSFLDRQAMFKWAIEEHGEDLQAVDLDLDKIKAERKKAEAELENLKKQLEEKKKKEK